MHEQFAGEALVEKLKLQKIVAGDAELAAKIASVGEVIAVPNGTTVIRQGGDDGDVYLILDGSFHIVVNGRVLARRTATDHVGEMAAILPVQRRAASVIANEDSVIVRLPEERLAALADRYPQIWRCFVRELAHRVEQRNTVASSVSARIRVLVMASSNALDAARTLEKSLVDERFETTVWTEGGFRSAGYPIERLESVLDRSDVAIAVAGPNEHRDNIIFELGFFMGRLGRHRTFLIEPRAGKVELPPELAGVNTIDWESIDTLAPQCNGLREMIYDLGPNR